MLNEHSSVSIPSSKFDQFLFAPMCEEGNGMQISVISALARAHIDPWEEAGRLSTMPKAIAEKAIVSTLRQVSGRDWNSADAAAIARRLVGLLPDREENVRSTPTNIEVLRLRRQFYWLPWLGIALAISFLGHRAGPTTQGLSSPTQTEMSRSTNENADIPTRGTSE